MSAPMTIIPVGPKDQDMTSEEVIRWIRELESAKGCESMQRFKVASKSALGLTTPQIKAIAKRIGKDHSLAQKLWKTGIFEARCIAAMIDEPDNVTAAQMDQWAKAFDSWGIV